MLFNLIRKKYIDIVLKHENEKDVIKIPVLLILVAYYNSA